MKTDREKDDTGLPLPFNLRLTSLKGVRQSMARLVRHYSQGRLEDRTYRTLIWSMGQLVHSFKAEHDYTELAEKVEALEQKLDALNTYGD